MGSLGGSVRTYAGAESGENGIACGFF